MAHLGKRLRITRTIALSDKIRECLVLIAVEYEALTAPTADEQTSKQVLLYNHRRRID
ncbi:MAG: hypothetical protein KME27_08690 [Lyngbya sp. HA4199-MV5]|nr:hypothetical protein [Lyngbya sp. HA4199-MV5]